MEAEAQTTLELFDGKSSVRRVAGVYRGVDGSRVLVDFADGRVPAYSLVGYVPELNESVWVEVLDGVAYMLGPTLPKPAKGVVASTGSGTCTVTTSLGVVTATVGSGVSLTIGQIVKLHWSDGAHVLGVIGVVAAPVVPPPPSASSKAQTVTFTAVDSGSFQSYWWTNDVRSSASNRGAWFYGSKIRDTIPSTASIVSASIYLPKPKRLLGSRPFGRHTHGSKPGGGISIVDDSTLSATSGWVPIPTTLVDDLKTAVGGLGFDIGGYNVWPGTQADGQSGSLRVTYDS